MHRILIEYQDPIKLFYLFEKKKYTVLLHSASHHDKSYGRYSYIGIDSDISYRDITLEKFSQYFTQYKQNNKYLDMPPFQGGFIGYFSYDYYFFNKKLLKKSNIPFMYFRRYYSIISFDHLLKKSWIISNTINKCMKILLYITKNIDMKILNNDFFLSKKISSNFTRTQYIDNIKKAIQYIKKGDIFEVNISQKFSTSFSGDTYTIYRKLMKDNPSPFSAYINMNNNSTIISCSPERFLKIEDRNIECRPIKGTIKKTFLRKENILQIKKLKNSEKDIAENIMIVDLMRNDLSRSSEKNSIFVSKLCSLESYKNIYHLVSVINSKLKKNISPFECIKHCFPAGSITGAPKESAINIINTIEDYRREIYCGNIGYIGFNGSIDFSVAIRTLYIHNNNITFNSGGAITIQSDPLEEYWESYNKSKAIKYSLEH